MDVGDPSNFVRILELFDQQFKTLKDIISSYSISDVEIKEVIKKVYQKNNYLLDPHGAVGYLGLEKYIKQQHGLKGIFLETAHPVKFYDVVEPITQQPLPIPAIIQDLLKKEKQSIKMDYDYEVFKDYLLASG
jgi:threonine synthase